MTATITAPIDYMPGYLGTDEADRLLDHLTQTTPWQTKTITIMGRTNPMPRLICWVGDANYVFSGSTQEAQPWTPELADLRDRLAADTGARYNSVLLNLYRGGQDSIAWHSDDEPELGPTPTIASISLGSVRDFVLRRKDGKTVKQSVPLEHGSLVVMRDDSQSAWQHSVPKRARVSEPRVNLTFRWFEPR
ncbi:alpha-ketoglutarate-dependent dioxygenase AlkB [Ornithinimicrobium ciconiae]|uniref:Alpha-ketoglutarate-dependent dioxygenase AlkB n=1 Tax=Ornithinimicrobium ciconiae TaxID=2594265 RepID=A0A516GEK4_9MICO|nr:alpha-ketoglutarate-dependent dioxygenase AlkB [Ornithinimicrobium ciconiae]QDO89941.1 alpha-ketoglutarate-dependent dioxygenase AlkB [Ornithinimicrobium ciconiae]